MGEPEKGIMMKKTLELPVEIGTVLKKYMENIRQNQKNILEKIAIRKVLKMEQTISFMPWNRL